MGRIHISKVTPGMVLESDVFNEANQLILPEGLKVNDKAIEKLTYYGITSVHIEGMEDDEEFLHDLLLLFEPAWVAAVQVLLHLEVTCCRICK